MNDLLKIKGTLLRTDLSVKERIAQAVALLNTLIESKK
jgi:hypothetical protein